MWGIGNPGSMTVMGYSRQRMERIIRDIGAETKSTELELIDLKMGERDVLVLGVVRLICSQHWKQPFQSDFDPHKNPCSIEFTVIHMKESLKKTKPGA